MKIINYHSRTATSDNIVQKIVNNPDADKNLVTGEISTVLTKDNEALYTLNYDNTNVIEYKPFYQIKSYVDNITDNLENNIQEVSDKTDTKINNITGTNAINCNIDNNKNAVLSLSVNTSDKVLNIEQNTLKSSIGLELDDRTINLTGTNNTTISTITIPSENITLIDTVGGTKILNTNANLIVINSASQIVYIGLSNTKQEKVTFYNNSSIEVFFSFNNETAGMDKFVKDNTIDLLTLPINSSIQFVKVNDGWHISSLYGLTYFPDLSDVDRNGSYAITVDNNGLASVTPINIMKSWDESVLNDLTSENLESMFPNVPVGYQFVCYTIGKIYEKVNDLGGWLAINCEKI